MIEVFAPAKVNLYLHVVGRRPDGYHLLDSLVVFVGVGDSLRLEPGQGLHLALEGPTAPLLASESDNIVLRAAAKLAQAVGRSADARISLTKRLPVAAGIGGGSADAAAALQGLCQLWAVEPPDLAAIGLSLGADLPVCLRGQPTQMAGVGEQLQAAPVLPPAWLVLVNPRVAVPTPMVFKGRQGPFSQPAPLLEAPANAIELAGLLANRHNDLTDPAIALAPVIAEMLTAIDGTNGCLLARMSGSGATCFGLYGSESDAEEAAERLASHHPDWWIAAAPILGEK